MGLKLLKLFAIEPLNINALLKAVKLQAAKGRRVQKDFYYYTHESPRGGNLQGKHEMVVR